MASHEAEQASTTGERRAAPLAREPQVVVLGHVLNERVIFPDHVLFPVLGSPAAYASICLARLGLRVGLVTKVGPDFPPALLQALDDAGLPPDGIVRCAASTDNELLYHPDGRKTIRFLSRADPIGFADVPPAWRRAPMFYVCPMDREIGRGTLEQLRQLDACVVADLGGFGGATSPVHPEVKDGHELEEVCPLFDVVKASTEDLEYTLGTPPDAYAAAARTLLRWGAAAVVVTRGRDGAVVVTAKGSAEIPAYVVDQAQVVDQTGAGDCFSAGFLAEYLRSRDPFAAAVYGSAVTSFVLQRTGGAAVARMPTRAVADGRARELWARMRARAQAAAVQLTDAK